MAPAAGAGRVAVALTVGAVLAVEAAVAPAFFMKYAFDDSFVGYAIARNLLAGHGFAFDPGVAVLNTSAPLAPLLYAALAGLFHADVVTVAQIVSLVAYLALGPLAYFVCTTFASRIGATLGALALVTSPFVLTLWSHESLLSLTCSALGTVLILRKADVAAGAAFAAAVLFRQEAVFALAVAAVAAWRAGGGRALLRLGAVPVPALAGWAIFAFAAFGTVFTQTMAVKVAMATYPLIQSYARGLAEYASTCFRFSMADQTDSAGLAYGGAAVLSALMALRSSSRAPGSAVAVAIALACAASVLLYVALGVAFFVWFCTPVAVLVAEAVALPWNRATGYPAAPGSGLFLRSARALSLAVVVAGGVFAAREALGIFPAAEMTGYFPANAYRTSGYHRLGELLARLPPDAVIAYDEPGQLRYYSGRTILDYQGMTHPGAAAYLRAHHPEWTLERYRPGYFLLDVDDRNLFFRPDMFAWFARAYAPDGPLLRTGRTGTRARFRLYRLRDVRAIPALPAEAAI